MTENPIFIFSASWRTGSTLLQRVFNSTGNVLIWGEPQHLNQSRKLYTDFNNYFESAKWQYNAIEKEGINMAWTPILSPKTDYLLPAFKALYDNLYMQAAKDMGFVRWGFKEVRIHAFETALWFKEMYPNAKFIFHYRNPFDMFESVIKTDFYSSFQDPYFPIRTWKNNIANVFRNTDSNEIDFFHVKHEDLINPDKNDQVIKSLFEYVAIDYDFEQVKTTLSKKVGGSNDKSSLSEEQKDEITTILGNVLELAYAESI